MARQGVDMYAMAAHGLGGSCRAARLPWQSTVVERRVYPVCLVCEWLCDAVPGRPGWRPGRSVDVSGDGASGSVGGRS